MPMTASNARSAVIEAERFILKNGFDHQIDMRVFNTDKIKVSEVLEGFGLTNDNRWIDAVHGTDNAQGTWEKWRKNKTLHFQVCVGCYCDSDCCGHQCGQDFYFAMNGKYLTVVNERHYNY